MPGQEGLFTVAKTAEPIEQLKGVDMQLVVSLDGERLCDASGRRGRRRLHRETSGSR